MNLPHIVSRINGIKVPFLRGQEGIMHRFQNQDNRLVVASVDAGGSTAKEPEMLVIPGTKEGADLTPRQPKTAPSATVSL